MRKRQIRKRAERFSVKEGDLYYRCQKGGKQDVTVSGNRFILTLSDYYTKWVDAVPLPSKHAIGVAASLLKES
ncbi:hypothetical protein EMCRGX_G025918 [Ephydatia muelleri]